MIVASVVLYKYAGNLIVATSKAESKEFGSLDSMDGIPLLIKNIPSLFKYNLSILGK